MDIFSAQLYKGILDSEFRTITTTSKKLTGRLNKTKKKVFFSPPRLISGKGQIGLQGLLFSYFLANRETPRNQKCVEAL